MGADPVQRELSRLEHADRCRPTMRAEVGTSNVKFLVVTDNAPVDAGIGPENAVLDVGTKFSQQPQPLRYGGGVATAFKVHVRSVPSSQVSNRSKRVLRRHIDGDVGAAQLRHLELAID